MKGTAREEDTAQATLECTGRMQLDLSKFVSATTDGCPAERSQEEQTNLK